MRLFGEDSLVFDDWHGLSFVQNNDIQALLLEGEEVKTTRLIVDHGDSPRYWNSLYEWSDVYAKTNIREEDLHTRPKSIPLGRGFPIKSFSTSHTLRLGISNYIKARHRIRHPRRFFSLYHRKAIVSTPLLRMLPAPLVDGVHLLYTDGSQEDMVEKIRLIREDPALRKSLEDNARAYYEEHLRPEKVVARILRKAGVPLPRSLD